MLNKGYVEDQAEEITSGAALAYKGIMNELRASGYVNFVKVPRIIHNLDKDIL
jgi:hypothetical protein